jgi:hypothetical protein
LSPGGRAHIGCIIAVNLLNASYPFTIIGDELTRNELTAAAEALEWAGDPLSEAMGHQALILMIRERAAELRAQAAALNAAPKVWNAETLAQIAAVNPKALPECMPQATALEAPKPIGWVHPAYLPGNGLSGALSMDVSPMRLSQQQVPLYLAPPDQSARIAEYRVLLDLACRQAECEMLLTGDEIRRIRAALEKPWSQT